MEEWTRKHCSYITTLLCLLYVSLARCVLTEDMKLEIVNIHNRLRRGFAQGSENVTVSNMKKLVWSTDLEEEARRKLRLHCRLSFFHFPDSNKYSNIARSSNGNFTSDILHWYNEIHSGFLSDYQICWPNDCNQAKSMLDANHRYIGCSFRRNCGGTSGALLCLYRNNDPNANNVSIEFYDPGRVCTHCTYPTSFCDEGLCTSCDSNIENCDCRKTCRHPGIGSGIFNETTCSCSCHSGLGPNCDKPCVDESEDDFMYYEMCLTLPYEECLTNPVVQSQCQYTCNLCRKYGE